MGLETFIWQFRQVSKRMRNANAINYFNDN